MQHRYHKISDFIHNDERYRSLPDDGKLLFHTLLTHQNMTSVGAMKTSPNFLADQMRWEKEKLMKAFRSLVRRGMVKYDSRACLLILPNYLKHNTPVNPNGIRSWAKSLAELPECKLKVELCHRLADKTTTLPKWFEGILGTVGEWFPEPFTERLIELFPERFDQPFAEHSSSSSSSNSNSNTTKQAAANRSSSMGAAAAGRQGGQKDQEHKDEVRSLVELWGDVGGRAEPSPQAFLDKSAETFGFKRVAEALDVLHDRPAFGGAKNQVAYFKAILEDRDNGHDSSSGKTSGRGKRGKRSAPSPRDKFGPTGKSVL